MTHKRTEERFDFETNLDYVTFKKRPDGTFEMMLDADDREAVYGITPEQVATVTEALKIENHAEFFDLLEAVLAVNKGDDLVYALRDAGTTEFYWMNTEQIEKFMIGGFTVKPIDKD